MLSVPQFLVLCAFVLVMVPLATIALINLVKRAEQARLDADIGAQIDAKIHGFLRTGEFPAVVDDYQDGVEEGGRPAA